MDHQAPNDIDLLELSLRIMRAPSTAITRGVLAVFDLWRALTSFAMLTLPFQLRIPVAMPLETVIGLRAMLREVARS